MVVNLSINELSDAEIRLLLSRFSTCRFGQESLVNDVDYNFGFVIYVIKSMKW